MARLDLAALLPDEPVWGEQDGATLRDFLSKPFGQLFLRRLMYMRPSVVGYDRDKRAIQSDERAGFEGCISEILRLAESK